MPKNRTLVGFLTAWLSGILLGALIASGADDYLLSVTRQTFGYRVSVIPLLLCAAFPFLIAAIAVLIERYWIFYLLSLVKGFALSFCACLIFCTFGSAGWLVQPMAQFTDVVLSMVFCLFCIRRCRLGCDVKWDLMFCLIIAAAAAVVDYLLVSQFLAALI